VASAVISGIPSAEGAARVVIRVHIACDDKTYRDTIAALLDDDDNISVVEKSREAEHGVAAVADVGPDVVVLAVPPNEDVLSHTRRYQTVAGREQVK
jgi:chemotaxis response regulator CheB